MRDVLRDDDAMATECSEGCSSIGGRCVERGVHPGSECGGREHVCRCAEGAGEQAGVDGHRVCESAHKGAHGGVHLRGRGSRAVCNEGKHSGCECWVAFYDSTQQCQHARLCLGC